MRALPRNPAGLTDRHLADTRRALLRIILSKDTEPFDRIRAAKEIRGWANDVWKWSTAARPSENETPSQDDDPLDNLKLVG